MAQSAEIYTTPTEYNNTEKVANISTLISQVEPSASNEIFLKSKIQKCVVDNVGFRCINWVKTTGSSVKNTNTNFKDMVTKFVLHSVLHHVGQS